MVGWVEVDVWLIVQIIHLGAVNVCRQGQVETISEKHQKGNSVHHSKIKNNKNKLGWAEPHSRFPQRFSIHVSLCMLCLEVYLIGVGFIWNILELEKCWPINLESHFFLKPILFCPNKIWPSKMLSSKIFSPQICFTLKRANMRFFSSFSVAYQ